MSYKETSPRSATLALAFFRGASVFLLLSGIVSAADPIAEQIIDSVSSKIQIDVSRMSELSCKGKVFLWFDGIDVPVIGTVYQACAPLDCAMLTSQTCAVVHAIATDTERPTFRIDKYQACMNDPMITDKNKCTVSPYWVSAGWRVAVGTPCDPQLIRGSGAAEYRKVTNGTLVGAAGCRCTAGSGFVSVPKESLVTYRKRYPVKEISAEDKAICDAGFAASTTPPIVQTSDHIFCISTDDGGRLTVNGIKVVDNWVEQNETRICGTVKLAPGTYPILAEMFDSGGNAAFKVFMDGQIIGAANLPTGGWDCSYFNSREPTGTPVLKRLEPSLNFTYGTASPGPGVNPDNFSASCVSSLRLP